MSTVILHPTLVTHLCVSDTQGALESPGPSCGVFEPATAVCAALRRVLPIYRTSFVGFVCHALPSWHLLRTPGRGGGEGGFLGLLSIM